MERSQRGGLISRRLFLSLRNMGLKLSFIFFKVYFKLKWLFIMEIISVSIYKGPTILKVPFLPDHQDDCFRVL